MSNAPVVSLPRIFVFRHGETEWSLNGRHTSRTDVPLTHHGQAQAARLRGRVHDVTFSRVFSSPRLRARQTAQLAALGPVLEIEPDLREWEYGDYEGRTGAEIRAERPAWNLFSDGTPGGESPAAVYARSMAFAGRLKLMSGDIAVFSHGHFLRVLASAWIEAPVDFAQRLSLGTASIGRLTFEHNRLDSPVISLWNEAENSPAPR